jgi:hypothetical protein
VTRSQKQVFDEVMYRGPRLLLPAVLVGLVAVALPTAPTTAQSYCWGNCPGSARPPAETPEQKARREQHERAVAEEIKRLGVHRREEAERIVKLREAAVAARKKRVRDPRCTGPYISCQ